MSLTDQHSMYGQPTYEADYLQSVGEGARVIRNDGAIPVYVDGFEWSAHVGRPVPRTSPYDELSAVDGDTIVARGVVEEVESDPRLDEHIIHVIPP